MSPGTDALVTNSPSCGARQMTCPKAPSLAECRFLQSRSTHRLYLMLPSAATMVDKATLYSVVNHVSLGWMVQVSGQEGGRHREVPSAMGKQW